MFVKQLSVFIENREGRLEQVTDVLKTQNINILSLSMADTTEYGMLRMVVSNPEVAKKALREEGFSAMLTDVLAVKLEDKVGELHKMTHILCSQGLNIEYMYELSSANSRAISGLPRRTTTASSAPTRQRAVTWKTCSILKTETAS